MAGVVLAGGRGSRVGGRDKGLLRYRGRPLARHGVDFLSPGCQQVLISANRNVSRYLSWADAVVLDADRGFVGPLAGIRAALGAVRTRYLITCPCDAPALDPRMPALLLRRLRLAGGADVAVLHDGQRLQPLLLVVRGHLGTSIDAYLTAGGRSVLGWLDCCRTVEVRWRTRVPNGNVRTRRSPWRPGG